MSDIIAAIATPTGEGGISIIRFSGLDSLSIAQKIFFIGQRVLVRTKVSVTGIK